jgi:hypothetical protein
MEDLRNEGEMTIGLFSLLVLQEEAAEWNWACSVPPGHSSMLNGGWQLIVCSATYLYSNSELLYSHSSVHSPRAQRIYVGLKIALLLLVRERGRSAKTRLPDSVPQYARLI